MTRQEDRQNIPMCANVMVGGQETIANIIRATVLGAMRTMFVMGEESVRHLERAFAKTDGPHQIANTPFVSEIRRKHTATMTFVQVTEHALATTNVIVRKGTREMIVHIQSVSETGLDMASCVEVMEIALSQTSVFVMVGEAVSASSQCATIKSMANMACATIVVDASTVTCADASKAGQETTVNSQCASMFQATAMRFALREENALLQTHVHVKLATKEPTVKHQSAMVKMMFLALAEVFV